MLGQWAIEKLSTNPANPRRDITADELFSGLVESVRSQGIIQPLLVTADGMILAGHRRYYAALEIGLRTVPVTVLSEQVNPMLVPLIENLQRSDLAVMEVAEYLRMCSREHGMSLVGISEATGISISTISKYLKLAEAPAALKERVERDEIPLNAAFELLRHDEKFIQEVIVTPRLTKQIVRERAETRRAGSKRATVFERAIRDLYNITDKLEEVDAPRSAMFKFADGIRELEAEAKRAQSAA